jgi:hypothetical protein
MVSRQPSDQDDLTAKAVVQEEYLEVRTDILLQVPAYRESRLDQMFAESVSRLTWMTSLLSLNINR